MKRSRISRVRVEKLADLLGYRLVTHQNLGNRKDYYYTYSLVKDNPDATCMKDSCNRILYDKALKEVYEYLVK